MKIISDDKRIKVPFVHQCCPICGFIFNALIPQELDNHLKKFPVCKEKYDKVLQKENITP